MLHQGHFVESLGNIESSTQAKILRYRLEQFGDRGDAYPLEHGGVVRGGMRDEIHR